MAASNQASSPSGTPLASSSTTSNQEDNKTSEEGAAAAVADTAAAMASTNTTNDSSSSPQALLPIPTYSDVQNSNDYQMAKELLNQGSFEPALETIAAAIASTMELLRAHYNHNKDTKEHAKAQAAAADDDDDDDDDEDYFVRCHESMAPLHYLYGTTLLYSIEESAEDVQGMTVGDSHDITVGDFVNGVEEPETNEENAAAADNEEEDKKPSASDEPREHKQALNDNDNNEEDDDDDDDAGDAANNITVDVAEDLQIAWENLETARHILAGLLDDEQKKSNKFKSTAGDATLSFQSDLAQIHLRLGDLQRMNGRYAEAIQDYETALMLRSSNSHHKDDDGHSATRSMEEDRKLADLHYNLALTYMTVSADPNQPEDKPPLEEDQKREYRNKAMQHYVACGKAFAAHAAQLCGNSVEDMIQDGPQDAPTDVDVVVVDQALASRTLALLRTRVESLPLPSDETDANKVQDIRELLREIHEAIDTAEEGEQGVQMVTEMKAQIQEAAEREATSSSSEMGTTIGFGASASLAATVDVQPNVMMVVKKKRKATECTELDKDSKQPKAE